MTAFRDVKKVVIAREQSEGVGARVRRSIGSSELRNLDPFLLLDEFNVSQPAGFPDHPHRGMQTVTYMLEGAFRHEDNKGHAGTIGVGDLQWMTAGRGIVHSEMPATAGSNIGLQLWVNLAAKDKMTKPQYQELLAEDVPLAKNEDGSIEVKVIAGKCFDVESKVFTQTPTLYWDVRMLKGATFEEQIPEQYNAFIYVLEGKVTAGKKDVEGEHGACMVFGPGEGVQIKSDDEARFVVLAGQPLDEPIVQHGPFVMNTKEQIMQAFRDYSAGKF
ncbi:pirin [Gracilaria domingensis]|nr:pirin [Gracilaria domingensis]